MGSSGRWLDFAVDEVAGFAGGTHQFEVELQAQLEAGRGAEVAAEAQVVLTRVSPTHPRSFGASRVRSFPKWPQVFVVFRVCNAAWISSCRLFLRRRPFRHSNGRSVGTVD